ncbi:15413_t:CDS:1 [Racocetra fulgida]|uniref:15413_t:CDS:1 n=1 Tax=Racocetra fulgida TaxID=60492 RepID=A0A9N9B490_9GLOM|nr:15413_t:CDS:1 [Racocetra fulgida]
MNNENGQPYKKWFKILFYAFHNNETAIEFPIDDDNPPDDFIKIINKNEKRLIKISSCTSSPVVWYWFKDDEPEIIDQAIEYIDRNFEIDQNIDSLDKSEREKFRSSKSFFSREQKMQKKLIDKLGNSNSIFPGFHYLFKYEWIPADSDGKNDMILTNGKGIFAIVETKRVRNIMKGDRKYKISYVIHQAGRYKQKFIEECNGFYRAEDGKLFDVIAVIGIGITEDNERRCFRPFDEQVCKILDRIYPGNDGIKPAKYGLLANLSKLSINTIQDDSS